MLPQKFSKNVKHIWDVFEIFVNILGAEFEHIFVSSEPS